MVYIAITGGRGKKLYCAIVWAIAGCGGVPKERVGAQRIVLIRAQEPRNKTISCIGQLSHRSVEEEGDEEKEESLQLECVYN